LNQDKMMKGIIGKKLGMTSVFDEDGSQISCTVVECEPNVVTQVRTPDVDGYEAVQVGYGTRKAKRVPSALKGHFKKAGVDPKRGLAEFRDSSAEDLSAGDEVRLEDVLEVGDIVHVTGTSKGKGFQGVVRRHGFGGVGMVTHGQHNRQRAPGSIGQSSDPSRVFKGTRMGGRMGNAQVTVKNLAVVQVLADNNMVLIRGAVPGPKNGWVRIEKA
jgi:large subunit ribosomal protein L3